MYLNRGLITIKYDKTLDNYKASFGNSVTESEMARIIDEIINIKRQSAFNVSDFLTIYNKFDNPLKFEKIFHVNNSRKLINHYLRNLKNNEFVYVERTKHWEKM